MDRRLERLCVVLIQLAEPKGTVTSNPISWPRPFFISSKITEGAAELNVMDATSLSLLNKHSYSQMQRLGTVGMVLESTQRERN